MVTDRGSGSKRCAFWIASGERYIKEAVTSSLSFHKHHPDIDRALFATQFIQGQPGYFEVNTKLPPRQAEHWYLDSVRYFNQAVERLACYDYLLYLDTDTHTCYPIYDVFEMLDRFDMVGAHAPGRQTARCLTDVPDAFPELNIGVLAFRRGLPIFAKWLAQYEQDPDHYGNNDQAPLRDALWQSSIRLGILPVEYNFRFGFGGQVRGRVRILHGRAGDMGAICQKLNQNAKDIRAYQRGELG